MHTWAKKTLKRSTLRITFRKSFNLNEFEFFSCRAFVKMLNYVQNQKRNCWKSTVKQLMVIIRKTMCDTNVGDDSSYYATIFSDSKVKPVLLLRWSFFFLLLLDLVVFRTCSWSPTCCRKSHMAPGDDLTVLPCWSVRSPACGSNTVWQALWTYARELISTQRSTPQQNSTHRLG